ncbi:hypothetical protein E4U56_005347 [Claviceps arundinis]|uniref:Uncharacterized protein n=1 Tax=Claviceps arundinis TaxID=1623583 RepID=A0A9P7SMS1_9HYPO|nr:hypothetical protein E4U56_005347 [Claviceps arundinis]
MTFVALPRSIPPHDTGFDVEHFVTPPRSLEIVDRSVNIQSCPDAQSDKHIPVCSTGPIKPNTAHTLPVSLPYVPETLPQRSLLFPADGYVRLRKEELCVFEIDSLQIAEAIEFASRQPLPPPDLMFPWLHGLNPKNEVQQTFLLGGRRDPGNTPACARGVLLVKADGDLSRSRLKGAVAPDEFMQAGPCPKFVEADPQEGFSVRNFHIQTAKAALVSDIIIYGEDAAKSQKVAWEVAAAQSHQRQLRVTQGVSAVEYNAFFCVRPYSEFEKHESNIVAVDSSGRATGKVLDFVQQERGEMLEMAQVSKISHNVYMGPTPAKNSIAEKEFDILIECSDLGQLRPSVLRNILKSNAPGREAPLHFDFPSSGILSPTWSLSEADGIVQTCKWIYHLSHGIHPAHEQEKNAASSDFATVEVGSLTQRRILIHCADGYTESTVLGIAYHSFSTGEPIPRAWLRLHTSKRRNFFAYPTDVSLLTSIAPKLLRESPLCAGQSLTQITALLRNEPKWLTSLDGSFPSKVLDYLYLGNIGHANNPCLLRELGIGQILSVGETASWRDGELAEWGADNVYVVEGVQDNGIDPLANEFSGCLEFISKTQSLVAMAPLQVSTSQLCSRS